MGAMLTPNRVVAVLTPIVFAPLAGAIAALLAEHFPGISVDKGSIEQVFIGGALIGLAPALQWLHGWQKYEARQAGFAHELALAEAGAEGGLTIAAAGTAEAASGVDQLGSAPDEVDDDVDDLDDLDDLEESDGAGLVTEYDELDELDELDRLDALDGETAAPRS